MNMKNKYLIISIVVIILALVGVYYWQSSTTKNNGTTLNNGQTSENTEKGENNNQITVNQVGEVLEKPAINFVIPVGWYRNDLDKKIFLTQKEQLPNIGGTEIYAYGPQMSLYQVGSDKDYNGVYSDYSGLENNVEFGTVTIGNMTYIKRVINASGTSKNILYYYLPVGDSGSRRVYTFSFYPYEKDASLADFNLFVENATKALSL